MKSVQAFLFFFFLKKIKQNKMYLQICRAWTRTEEAIFFLTLDQFLQSAPEKSFLFLVLQAFFFFFNNHSILSYDCMTRHWLSKNFVKFWIRANLMGFKVFL